MITNFIKSKCTKGGYRPALLIWGWRVLEDSCVLTERVSSGSVWHATSLDAGNCMDALDVLDCTDETEVTPTSSQICIFKLQLQAVQKWWQQMHTVIKSYGLHRLFHFQCKLYCNIAKACKSNKCCMCKMCIVSPLSLIPCNSALIYTWDTETT